MKLMTRDSDYAIRALTCMAARAAENVSVTELSKKLGIPRAFLRKILQRLNKKGILVSNKGKGGGFSLAVDPSNITVLHVIEAFQGSFELNEHVFKGENCPNIKVCFLKKKIDGIEKYVKDGLNAITINSLVKEGGIL